VKARKAGTSPKTTQSAGLIEKFAMDRRHNLVLTFKTFCIKILLIREPPTLFGSRTSPTLVVALVWRFTTQEQTLAGS